MPTKNVLDGRSFLPQLLGKKGSPKEYIYMELGTKWYVRSAKWKLNREGELFDMSNAPYQEKLVSNYAKQFKVEGIICGHIHHANMQSMNGIHYINDGDWVESCTALVEHFDGKLELINWTEKRKELFNETIDQNLENFKIAS